MTRTDHINRWMQWQPPTQIIQVSTNAEPTKPTKRGFEGFDALPDESGPSISQIDSAMDTLNGCGARILPGDVVAVPQGLYGIEVKAALKTLGMERLPVVLIPAEEVSC